MKVVINLLQIIVGVTLIGAIIVQQKGAGLGGAFGGDTGFYRTKRGAEKFLFYVTIGLSSALILLSIIGLAVE